MGIKPKHFFLFSCLVWVACAAPKKAVVQTPVAVAPVVQDTTPVKKDAEPALPVARKNYTIGLLLPLQLEAHFVADTNPDAELVIMPQVVSALHFYEGALAAADSLAKEGVDVKFRIFDSSIDSLEFQKQIGGKVMQSCDAVISLLPAAWNVWLARKWKNEDKPCVIVQHPNTQVLDSNAAVWLANPGNATQVRLMADYLYKTYPASNFVVVYKDVKKDQELASFFVSSIDTAAGTSTAQKIAFSRGGWAKVQSKLSKTKRNVIIAASSDESWITSLLTSMEEVKTDYTFLLAGLPTWENFETIDPERLSAFNTHIFSAQHIEISQPRVATFRKAFISEYHSDPSFMAFESFDLIAFLVKNWNQYGMQYSNYHGMSSFTNEERGFLFKTTGPANGHENQSMSILRYGDYQLLRVK